MTPRTRPTRPGPRREVLAALGVVCLVEGVLLAAYLRVSPGFVTEPRYLLYPFVWLNAAGLALVSTDRPAASTRRTAVAGGVAVGYFLLLAVVGGTVALAPAAGVDVYWRLPPGWGPTVVAGVGPLRIAPVPYRTLGYLALAYLLYARLLDTSRRALGGLVGLFSCVSCTFPLLAAALSGTVGGLGLAAATTWSYDLSTAVFLVTVAVLAWRPGELSTPGIDRAE